MHYPLKFFNNILITTLKILRLLKANINGIHMIFSAVIFFLQTKKVKTHFIYKKYCVRRMIIYYYKHCK